MEFYALDSIVELYEELRNLRERLRVTIEELPTECVFPYQHVATQLDKEIMWLGERTD